jgi:hypothetical protein
MIKPLHVSALVKQTSSSCIRLILFIYRTLKCIRCYFFADNVYCLYIGQVDLECVQLVTFMPICLWFLSKYALVALAVRSVR